MSSGVLAHTTKISLFLMFVAVFMAHQIKHWGLSITISQEGCTHRLADVGNRVHTRNDSDEDVRGYVCKCIPFRGLRYACPRLPTSASRCVLPSRQVFAISNVYRVSPSLGCPLVLSGEQFLCYYSKSPVNSTTKCIDFAIHSF